jgi:plasmid stabilization system protein ParE
VARVIYSVAALADFERIIEFLLQQTPDSATAAVARIRSAITVLESHPYIGRRVDTLRRELVVSFGKSGYLALYRYDARYDVVRILRIRPQREAGYRD